MAVLITGGAGFIGSHAAVEFLNKGYDLVILDNFSNSKPCVLDRIRQITGKDFRFYQIDLLDKPAVDKMFDECPDIDSCIHFAGLKAVGESVSKPLAYYHNNLTGTINLCNAMQEHGVKTLVFSSSATVYGDPATVPIREDFPTGNTTNPYGETKHMIERILKDLQFADTTWSISIDAADAFYSPLNAKPELLEIPFGNFDDSFMHETHHEYNRDCWMFFGEDRYKVGPRGGEFSYYTDYDQQHCLDVEGMHGRVFEDQVAEYHMTYIIGNDQPSYQSMDRIKEASMSMGYKFEIKDFRVKGEEAAVLISNIGVAPIYRDAYVAVGGVKGEYSLKNLMPGEEVWIHVKGEGVSAQAVPAIECAHLVPGQKIEYKADVQ